MQPLKSLVGCLVGGLLLLAVHSLWSKDKNKTPPQFKQEIPTSATGNWVLEDSLLFQKASLGTITAMATAPFDADSLPRLVVAGQNGAAHLSSDGKLLSSVRFERPGYRMVPVPVAAEKHWVFMNRGGNQQQVALFDSSGAESWRYGLGLDPTPFDMACGDLDGDGRPEFAVGLSAEGGLRLLDLNGAEKWRQAESNPWNVEIVDLDGDGKAEIVHTNADGLVRIRDGSGKLLREITYNTFVIYFSLCRWPKTDGEWVLINNSRLKGIQLMDFSGKVVTTFNPPVKGMRILATPVRLSAVEKPYFALLVCDCLPRHDTRLFLYDAEGKIVFEKSFPALQAALLAVPDRRGYTEKLLVGESEGAIRQFRLKLKELNSPN